MARKRATQTVNGLAQVRALSHPTRLRLLELFAARPRTTKQAAEAMDESPTRLYHHVAALERAGLIRLRETRPNRGTTEKYFEAVAHRFLADEQTFPTSRAGARERAAMGMLVFDQARNELARALATADDDSSELIVAVRGVLRLSQRAARALRDDLLGALTRTQNAARGPRTRGTRYAITISMVPVKEEGEE
ncbi:MAG: helix-turn-helix transcriptional regulator [Acidobacteria bacterium]|nr:helix-turn-helix transcriptional regulator [Acidobacteriota bacterium]MBV9476683.1 helix-turn-helix transcriptional regulator [Acidobacteriota bacterium]